MSLSKTNSEYLTQEEWEELDALRKAINYDPSQVCPQKMEEFTALFVRSLYGKGNPVSSQTK
jgi:hypothetical protein